MATQNLILGDNMAWMKTIPDKYYDLAHVDVNYGIGEDGSKNKSRTNKTNFGSKNTRNTIVKSKDYKAYVGNDITAPKSEYWHELMRVSKNQIVWGANHFISKIPFDSSCWIVWDKDNGLNDFADCELAWTSFNTAVRKFKWKWHGMLQEDMKNKQERIHPNEKPTELYKWVLNKYAKAGQKILDTNGGSFSHAIAAFDLGFDLDIIDLDEYYFNTGKARFDAHVLRSTEIAQFGYAKTAVSAINPSLFS